MLVTKNNWKAWASAVSHPSSPEDYNEAAVERLMKKLETRVVRVRGVRPQFDAINKVQLIDFKTDEERKYYDDTEARYIREKQKLAAKAAAGEESNVALWELVLLNKRCEAAEYCRRYHIVEMMLRNEKEGYATAAALKFKRTIIACVQIMVDEYGVSRDDISLIWGGGASVLSKKQKAKASLTEKSAQLEALGMDVDEMMETLDLKDVEDRVVEVLKPEHRLQAQSKEERQKEIDRFQSGKTKFCFFTFKSGGVGLSLHHSDEFCTQKVRRKPSGYAYEEDIPLIPIRPRKCIVAPTYSAIELVQGLGRCPRLTSLSNTEQVMLFYSGTVEVEVAHVVSRKLRCLGKVVRQRESWQDMIVSGKTSKDYEDSDDKVDEEDSELLGGGSEIED